MNNAERILNCLDKELRQPVELTLYGRAALQLGFPGASSEYSSSLDIDIVLGFGQAEALARNGNFWDAVSSVNKALDADGLYISHLFEEQQVILRPDWQMYRVALNGKWKQLTLFRLADADLLLSKLMRDDPIDRSDAQFLARQNAWSKAEIRALIEQARIPDIPELREQFSLCCEKLLKEVE